MPRYFFDTSALVKRYHLELGTDAVDTLFADATSTYAISRLGIVETTSAFALKVRIGELSVADFTVTRRKSLGEISRGSLKVARLLVAHYRNAEQLIDRHATTRRLRTLDALQLSVALSLREQSPIDTLVSADKELCAIAVRENLPTLDPTNSP